MHTNTFCKYRKNYSHRLACILLNLAMGDTINNNQALENVSVTVQEITKLLKKSKE